VSEEAKETSRFLDQQFTAVHSIHEARVSEEVDVSKYTFVGAAASLAWIITYHSKLPIEGATFAWFAPYVITLAGRQRQKGIQHQKLMATQFLKNYESKFLPEEGYMLFKAKDAQPKRWEQATDPNSIWRLALRLTLLIGCLGAVSAWVSPYGKHGSLWNWLVEAAVHHLCN